MKRKAGFLKRTFSMLLSFALVCGMLVFTANAAEAPISFVGGTASYAEDELTTGGTINIPFSVYLDPTQMAALGSLMVALEVYSVDGVAVLTPSSVDPDTISPSSVNVTYNSLDLSGGDIAKFFDLTDETNGNSSEYALLDSSSTDGLLVSFEVEYTVGDIGKLLSARDANNEIELNMVAKDFGNMMSKGSPSTNPNGVKRVAADEIGLTNAKVKITEYAEVTFVMDKDENGHTIPNLVTEGVPTEQPVKVPAGTDYPIPGITATYEVTNAGETTKYALKNWVASGEVTGEFDKEATISSIAKGATTLTAVYGIDTNGNGEADENEVTLKYSIREGDAEGISKVEIGTEEIDVATFSKLVLPATAVGENAAKVTPVNNKWVLKAYSVAGNTYEDDDDTVANPKTAFEKLQEHVVTDQKNTTETIEIQMLKDGNGNGVDDRDKVDVTLKYNGEEIGTVQITDGTEEYTITFDDRFGKDPITNPINKETNTIDISTDDENGVPASINNFPLDKDNFNENSVVITDEDGDGIDEVTIKPPYSDTATEVPTTFPGKVIDGTDPNKEDDKVEEDPTINLKGDAVVIFRDVDGTTELTRKTPAEINDAAFTYPEVALAKDGNPFLAWKITGINNVEKTDETFGEPWPADAEIDVPHYFADPKYDERTATLKVNDADGNPVVPGDEVHAGTVITVKDKNGNDLIDPVTITEDNVQEGADDVVITLPGDDVVPAKNGDDYFTGEWDVVKTDTSDPADGVDDKYDITPKYGAPQPDKIEIIPVIPGDDPVDPKTKINSKTNSAYTVLRGFHDNETTATAWFFVSIYGKAATVADLNDDTITVNVNGSHGFESIGTSFGNISKALAYDKTHSTEEYGAFYVKYDMNKSGVVSLSLSFNYDNEEVKALDHDVILVGDPVKDGYVDIDDVIYVGKVAARKKDTPKQIFEDGVVEDYKFELSNMDKDDENIIDIDDVTIIGKVAAGKRNIGSGNIIGGF